MISKIGERFTDLFRRNMPDAFVFALLLTLVTGLLAYFWIGTPPMKIIQSWYDGFWTLLTFGMQMVLLIITGYSIALSPLVARAIDYLARYLKTPRQVYFLMVLFGMIVSMISWGWLVITALLARELALRVNGINFPYLIACVYFSSIAWVSGLSSSIPLLLNTEKNYMIETGILSQVIPTSFTLGSFLNLTMVLLFLVLGPLIMLLLVPKDRNTKDLKELLGSSYTENNLSIKQEAASFVLPYRALSDKLNNSMLLQWIAALMGMIYIIFHFSTKGFDLNLNIMIFTFLILGLFLHQTPMRFGISMKRASGNISGILFQFPFYAGIMGIMTFTGLGEKMGQLIATYATMDTYPFFAYLLGGMVNFAIPSGGGEFAVIGPSIIDAVHQIGAGQSATELTQMTARASLAIAYGEGLTNLLQPFYLLLVLPIMASGVNLQARDVMGYLVVPFLVFFILQSIMVVWMPL